MAKKSISGKESKTDQVESPFDFMAREMFQALKKEKLLKSHDPNIPVKWSAKFKSFSATVKVKEIKEILKWFLGNLDNQYLRNIRSADTFCKRFEQIKLTKERSLPSQEEISDLAHKISQELLSEFDWSYGEDINLPAAVQKSITAYEQFRPTIVKILDEPEHLQNDRGTFNFNERRGLVFWIVEGYKLCPVEDFMIEWFRRAKKGEGEWQGWRPRLDQIIWRADHDKMIALGRNWSFDYTHSSLGWDQLMRSLSLEAKA